MNISQHEELLNILGVEMVSKKWKIKFKNKIIKKLIYRYFNIRNCEISKYRSFYISTFQISAPTQVTYPTLFQMISLIF